jgi:hypothetical protein
MSACLACIGCAGYPHVMQVMSGALETCTYALETCVSSCTGMTDMFFFMLKARDPQGAVGHVAASESTSVERRGPEPYDMWQHQSPSQMGGEVRSYRTRGNAGAHLSREMRSEDIKYVAALEPTSTGRRCLVPYDTW